MKTKIDKTLILSRIKNVKNFKTDAELADFLGINTSTLSNWYSRNSIDFDILFSKCEDVSLDYLLNGEGEMLKNNSHRAIRSNTGIALVNLDAIAGFGNNTFSITEQDIQALYEVPDFHDIDFMIRVKGNSMYPKYSSGDIIACRVLKESKFIEWNKPHLIATTEHGIIVKRLKKGTSSKSFLAVSDNKEYEPFEIPTNEITGIALVVGVIRLE